MHLALRLATMPPPETTLNRTDWRQFLACWRTLRLAPEARAAGTSMADLHPIVKAQYHTLAKRYHPDTQAALLASGEAPPRLATGATFRRITQAYEWLMALPPSLCVGPPADVVPVSIAPVMALPLMFERWPLALGDGWQEVSAGW